MIEAAQLGTSPLHDVIWQFCQHASATVDAEFQGECHMPSVIGMQWG